MQLKKYIPVVAAFLFAVLLATNVMAQADTSGVAEPEAVTATISFDVLNDLVRPLVLSIVFTLVGIVLFLICIWLVVKCAPFCVQKEIEEDQNTALGIIMGSMILGIAIILSAAMIG